MGLQTVPAYIAEAGYNHPAETFRNITKSVFGRTGLCRVGSFAVAPTATPLQVSIAAGSAVLVGSESTSQGAYHVWSNASENKTFGAPSAQPRIDTLLLRVYDNQYGVISGLCRADWDIVQGTPAGSPAALADSVFNSGGASYQPGAWFRVADVRINVGDGAIPLPAGQITPNLRYIRSGGYTICTSTTRPSDPQIGDRIYETDTKTAREYDGSYWRLPLFTRVGFQSAPNGGEAAYATIGSGANAAILTMTGVVLEAKSAYELRWTTPIYAASGTAGQAEMNVYQTSTAGTNLIHFGRADSAYLGGQTNCAMNIGKFVNSTTGDLTKTILLAMNPVSGVAMSAYGNANNAWVEIVYCGPNTLYPNATSVS